MTYHAHSRKGNVAVLVAVCLSVLIGFAALTLDGGLIQHNRRSAQAAADAAALAAANDLYLNYPIFNGADPGSAAIKAKAAAAANGYNNDGVTNKVFVRIPPTTGENAGKLGYAEVFIEYYQQAHFSQVWSNDKTTITGRAVARGRWAPFRNGILVLNPTEPASLNNNGNGLMKVVDADVIVNSNAPDGGVATGGGSIIAPTFYFSGNPGYGTSGSGYFQGTIFSKQPPTPDPLAYLVPPDPLTMILQSRNSTNISGNKIVTIEPGVYKGGIHVSGQAQLIMKPGIYYMEEGAFSFTGQGTLFAEGVMIYTAPKSNSDVVNVNGTGAIRWTPMDSGPYKGIALWQDRTSVNTVYVTGNGTSQMYGTFYAKKGMLTVSGNGAQDVLGSQYISDKVNLGGNGNFNIQWQHDQTARGRDINLVE